MRKKQKAQRGSVLVITGLMMPVIFAAVFLGCDLGRLYILGSALQNSADLAALSGARALYNFKIANPKEDPSFDYIQSITATVVKTNVQYPEFIDENAEAIFHETYWGSYSKEGLFTQDGTPLTAVRVRVHYRVTEKSFLRTAFGFRNLEIVREATAHFCPGPGGFVLLEGICPCGNGKWEGNAPISEICDPDPRATTSPLPGSCTPPDPPYQIAAPGAITSCQHCSSECTQAVTQSNPGPFCGDGRVQNGNPKYSDGRPADENCDDGNNTTQASYNGKICTPQYGGTCSYCDDNCKRVNNPGPHCGDGIVQRGTSPSYQGNPNEQCDEGETGGATCNSQCTCAPGYIFNGNTCVLRPMDSCPSGMITPKLPNCAADSVVHNTGFQTVVWSSCYLQSPFNASEMGYFTPVGLTATGPGSPCPSGWRVPTGFEMSRAFLDIGPGRLGLTPTGYKEDNTYAIVDTSKNYLLNSWNEVTTWDPNNPYINQPYSTVWPNPMHFHQYPVRCVSDCQAPPPPEASCTVSKQEVSTGERFEFTTTVRNYRNPSFVYNWNFPVVPILRQSVTNLSSNTQEGYSDSPTLFRTSVSIDVDGTTVSATCPNVNVVRAIACGNWIQESGELCDDGNTNNGDGCSSTCRNEPTFACTVDKQTVAPNEYFQYTLEVNNYNDTNFYYDWSFPSLPPAYQRAFWSQNPRYTLSTLMDSPMQVPSTVTATVDGVLLSATCPTINVVSNNPLSCDEVTPAYHKVSHAITDARSSVTSGACETAVYGNPYFNAGCNTRYPSSPPMKPVQVNSQFTITGSLSYSSGLPMIGVYPEWLYTNRNLNVASQMDDWYNLDGGPVVWKWGSSFSETYTAPSIPGTYKIYIRAHSYPQQGAEEWLNGYIEIQVQASSCGSTPPPCGNGNIDSGEQCDGGTGCSSCQCEAPYQWNGISGNGSACSAPATIDLSMTALLSRLPSEPDSAASSSRTYTNGTINTYINELLNLGGRAATNVAISYKYTDNPAQKFNPPYVMGLNDSIASIPPGGSQSLQRQNTNGSPAVQTTYWVVACADPNNVIAESDESNNCSAPAEVIVGPAAIPCGNGSLDSGEQCDDGNTTDDGNGCSSACAFSTKTFMCPAKPANASWNTVDRFTQTCTSWNSAGRTCTAWNPPDDNTTELNAANSATECRYTLVCGNGTIDTSEQCDGGANCNSSCQCPSGYESDGNKGCRQKVLSLVCTVDKTTAQLNDPIRYTATVSNYSTASFQASWNEDGFQNPTVIRTTPTINYNTSAYRNGTMNTSVRVIVDGQTLDTQCPVVTMGNAPVEAPAITACRNFHQTWMGGGNITFASLPNGSTWCTNMDYGGCFAYCPGGSSCYMDCGVFGGPAPDNRWVGSGNSKKCENGYGNVLDDSYCLWTGPK